MNDLISRAEAIDALKRKQDDGKGDLSRFYNTIIQHDIEAIMQLPPIQPKLLQPWEVLAAQSVLSQPEPHWIPVTEEPKKEEKSYWVCLEDGGQCQCRWTNDVYGIGANPWSKWGWKKVDLPQFSKVVAYMPLPEPYKGVTT